MSPYGYVLLPKFVRSTRSCCWLEMTNRRPSVHLASDPSEVTGVPRHDASGLRAREEPFDCAPALAQTGAGAPRRRLASASRTHSRAEPPPLAARGGPVTAQPSAWHRSST